MLNYNFPARSLALTVLACLIPAGAQAASDPKGIWLNDTGRGAIEIKDCGGSLCGHVVWVKDGADAKGCGKQIIGEARRAGGTTWGGGWVYSPEKKRRYDVELTPLGDDKLRVVGYAGIKLFSQTMVWKRAPADLQRCASTDVAAKADAPKPTPAAPVAAAPVQSKSSEVNSHVPKAPEPNAPAATTPEGKAPETTARESTAVGAKAPDVKPMAAPAPSKPATEVEKSTEGSTTGEQKTAQAGEENKEEPDAEPAGNGKIDLGDIDVSKFLKKTDSGNCKLDLPWVKIEFGCE